MDPATTLSPVFLTAIGAALVAIGTGISIAWLGSATVQSIARQPEGANSMTKAMIIAAAMIEGVALFCALTVLLTLILK